MNIEYPSDEGPIGEWFRPLVLFAGLIQDHHLYRFFVLTDFMIMGRVVRQPRPTVFLYKHYYTRRYLNIDDAGTAYRYTPSRPGSNGSGRYVRHRDLRTAVAGVGLWELPSLKPGLEVQRHRADDTDSWPSAINYDEAHETGGRSHGHLRLV